MRLHLITIWLAYSRFTGWLLLWKRLQCSARHVTEEERILYLATQRSDRCNSYTPIRCMQICRIRAISFDSKWGRKTMRKTARTNDEVRLDICTESFWVLWMIGQKTFVVVRVFDPNARRYSKQTLK